MMRLVGIVDAVTTGDLALASNNPVQWMMEDAGLPKDTLNSVLSLKERAVEAGRRRVIERLAAGTGADQAKAAGIRETSLSDFSADMLAKFEAEGRADYEESLDAYARQYLAARNVVAISRSDISKAAASVVNRRYAKEADVGSEDFVRRHTAAGHYEDARRDVIAKVAENTMKGVIAYNTHAGFGNQMTTSTAYSLNRAMRHGTMPEVAAALREVPAFRAMKPVFDLSGGTGLAEDFGGAVGRAGDVSELLTFDPDSGKWTEGQLRKVLNAMRRPYGQASEAEDRREAGKWLRRLSIAASRQAPVSVVRQSDSSEAPVTYSRVADAKTGEPLVVATVFGADGVTEYVTPPCRDYADVARDLNANGYACEMPKVVLMEDVSFSSKDATSMAVFLLGDRRAARAYYERFIDEERFMPPYLRRKDGDWEFDEATAAKKLREELAAMRTDSYVRTSVMGDGRADSPFRWGYESVSQKLLEERQVPRTTLDTAARTVAGEATYVVHTSGLPLGNTLFVTSDYFSDGDGEALLRSTLSQAIYQSMVDSRIAGGDHPYVMAVYREMTAAFDQAASKLVAELRESDPERADRLQAAVDALPKSAGRDGTSPDRLAAIASAVVFFTCDRGVGSDGNGFLTAPELAYIADEARVSKWTPLFFSVLDEALGGTGFFSDTRSANGLRRIVEAFSPSSAEIVNARTTSLFRNGEKAAPVRFPWIRWSRETGADGSTALSPTVGVHEPEDDFSSTALGTYVDRVADNCRGFAEAFKSEAGETLTPGRMYEMLKRSDMGGGETAAAPKPSVRAAAVNVNGVVHTIPASNHAPLAASVIDDETAFAIARSLRFLNPKVDDSTTAYHGRVAAKESRDDIVRFLETRGMTPQNIDRVVAKAFEAWGADDRAAVDTDDDEARDEVAAQVAEEGNAELAQSEHASRGVVTSKDLMALGRQLSYVFPTEGSNYTAVLLSLADEMSANAQRLEAELGGAKQASDRWEWQLARFLNVLRSPRNGTATAEEAKAERFDDPAVTDALLDQAIYDMHSQGRDTAAFALSAIRGVNPRGKHRTQVLRLVAYMDQKDAEQLSVAAGADGFSVTSSPLRYGGQANFASVRAVTRGIVLSDVFRTRNPNASAKSRSRELQAVCYAIARLINRNDYSETDFAERYGRDKDKRVIMPANGDGLTGKTAAEFYSLLGKATEDQSKLVAEIRTIVAAGRTPNAAEHERIVRFANLLAQRYESVAKAFEYLFGPDNEVCRALRNRELVASTVQNVEALMEVPQGDERRSVAEAILEATVRDFERTGATKSGRYTICSQLLSDIVMPVIDGSIVAASRMKGSRASVSSARGGLISTSVAEAGLLQEDLLAAVRSSGFDELYYHTDLRVNLPKGVTVPADAKLEDFVGSKATFSSSSRSTVTRLVEGLYRSMPRSTVKVTGTDSDELAESSNVAAVEPCPRPLEDRIVDRLFSRVKDAKGVTLRERFLSRGRRFADGTRLGTVCAGAKAGETVLDKSHLSMFVYKANLDRFVSGDTRNVRFEIYHGEKPTVLSLNLPDYVARLLYADITERAQYTRNRVTDSVVESLPKNWGSLRPESRKDAYRAMFSVLADMAGCQYITSKRTQSCTRRPSRSARSATTRTTSSTASSTAARSSPTSTGRSSTRAPTTASR